MFSGGEKNSFFCSVIGNNIIATLAEKNHNFTSIYNVLRYQGLNVLYFFPGMWIYYSTDADK
jgi:hypothetical protein